MAPLSPVAGNESQYDLSRHSDEVHEAPALSGGGGEQPDLPGEEELGGGGLQYGPAEGAEPVRVQQ